MRHDLTSEINLSNPNKKSAFLKDSLLSKRNQRKKIIYIKMIQATLNLNNYFGLGRYSREKLFERVNLYLNQDSHKSISLRTFDNYLQRFKTLRYDNTPIFASRSHKLGENRGSTFSAEVSNNALYLLNKFFYKKKVAVLEHHKVATVEHSKIAADKVYYKNLFTSHLSHKPKENLFFSQRSRSPKEKRALISTERILDKSFLGTGAYRQALKDLEGMEVSKEHTIEIERILINSIAKENATLNLRDFVRDLKEEKRKSGIQIYLKELRALKGSMGLMRKGSEKYNRMLKEVSTPKVSIKILSIEEEEEDILQEREPLTHQEIKDIETMWEKFRKSREDRVS